MYYDLTKEEFKEYEKEFKSTYIGRKEYISKIIVNILFIFFVLDFCIGIAFKQESELVLDIFQIAMVLLLGICLIGSDIGYAKELKEYIIEKSKNNKKK